MKMSEDPKKLWDTDGLYFQQDKILQKACKTRLVKTDCGKGTVRLHITVLLTTWSQRRAAASVDHSDMLIIIAKYK